MKKLKLSLQNIEGAEVLTRQQLKMVMGGVMSDIDSGLMKYSCRCTENDKRAGMDSCDGCDDWCKNNGGGEEEACLYLGG